MKRTKPVVRVKHRMRGDSGPVMEFEEILPTPEHLPVLRRAKAHNMPNEQMRQRFHQLDKDRQRIFEVMYGLDGRGALMSEEEIAAFLRRYLHTTVTTFDIRKLAAEAVTFITSGP